MSNRHVHADMIIAKAENRDLVKFYKSLGAWYLVSPDERGAVFYDNVKYFLCLPQHNEDGQCLRWLNGGDAEFEFLPNGSGNYGEMEPLEDYPWVADHLFMDAEINLRIKPKKEKRWIRFTSKGDFARAYTEKPDAMNKGDQLIEIEVEV
ncbi:hypothetical protein NVP1238A_71 [Vibrio phage 1.238.A._10N.261.52.F10]|uniref:Uncharacterized protein n=1 Tax=Vibrio phage 1.238.A._10N.261.52.F10 TaxID=1881231 RepID=A0A2I7RUI8_9CAUD|nr:hypothetical protein KNT79_gp71 [Vibrio phage 1.238.A._10N.261.52.F10]AUR97320.1 hypothetical protein NVP1238A_71 [Vibrio phage 1.238.A._10N.261.52.F10]AUR97414.1 hypothetical protein NVP1238B_72 [Vibrio phage 1.238.B._10N.261.52.F10]